MKKILQILPAKGWLAVFDDDEAPDALLKVPLVCWALIQHEDGETTIEGMDALDDVGFCEINQNFVRYEPVPSPI